MSDSFRDTEIVPVHTNLPNPSEKINEPVGANQNYNNIVVNSGYQAISTMLNAGPAQHFCIHPGISICSNEFFFQNKHLYISI